MKLSDEQDRALGDLCMLGLYIARIEINTGVTGLLAAGVDGEGRAFTFNLSELMRDVTQLTTFMLLVQRPAPGDGA